MTLHHLNSAAYIKDSKHLLSITEKDNIVKDKNLALIGYFEWDCETSTDRDEFVEQLQRMIKIDSHGECINNQVKVMLRRMEPTQKNIFYFLLVKYFF